MRMHHMVWTINTCPAYVLQSSVELQIRDQDGLVMSREQVWKGFSILHAQNKLQTRENEKTISKGFI